MAELPSCELAVGCMQYLSLSAIGSEANRVVVVENKVVENEFMPAVDKK